MRKEAPPVRTTGGAFYVGERNIVVSILAGDFLNSVADVMSELEWVN
jgi:hypothetical protein